MLELNNAKRSPNDTLAINSWMVDCVSVPAKYAVIAMASSLIVDVLLAGAARLSQDIVARLVLQGNDPLAA